MLKQFYGFLFIFIISWNSYSQQGILLNQTHRFLDAPEMRGTDTHNSIILYNPILQPRDSVVQTFDFRLNPVATAMIMVGNEGDNLFHTREGGYGYLDYKNIVHTGFSVYHEISSFPGYMKTTIDSLHYIPGRGRSYTEAGKGYSQFHARGNITVAPLKSLNFSFGNDKFFLGNGYRSLLLSDNSAAYPYFAVNLKVWHIQYHSITTVYRDLYFPDQGNAEFRKKFGQIHYLSWNITPSLNINLFEAILYRSADSSLNNGLNIHYLNPVIFMRPVEYAQGSTDNALVGMGFNANIYKNLMFYSQFILDEFYASEFLKKSGFFTNKYGFQLGIRDYASFHKNLKWLIEYNQVRPYTYSHYSTLQNYGNTGEPLAHELGANFRETTGVLFYNKKKIYSSLRFTFAQYGKDSTDSNFGNNIYNNFWDVEDLYGHRLLQGIKVSRSNLNGKVGYMIKPEWNMAAEAGFVWQKEKTSVDPLDYFFFYIGLKTLLYNDWFE